MKSHIYSHSDSFCLLKNTFPWAFVALHLYVFELEFETYCSLNKLFLEHHSSVRLVTGVTVAMMSVESQCCRELIFLIVRQWKYVSHYILSQSWIRFFWSNNCRPEMANGEKRKEEKNENSIESEMNQKCIEMKLI